MRRNTPSAIEFGKYLASLRKSKHITMQELGRRTNTYAATVSQFEHGDRAFPEKKIVVWSEALGVSQRSFRSKWNKCTSIEDPPISRNRKKSVSKDKLQELIDSLVGLERTRVLGYVEAVIEER
jgi:transcriptional regulator with XRE-family HTH domain